MITFVRQLFTQSIFCVGLLEIIVSLAIAAPCSYEKIKITGQKDGSGVYKINSSTELQVEGGQDDHDSFEGPLWIVHGKKRCKVEGGIFSSFYLSHSQQFLMTTEYSGSCQDNRTIDLSACRISVVKASYCGKGQLEEGGTKLVNRPACEPLNAEKKLENCTTAHVYNINDECKLDFDENASKALTKKELGIELPMNGSYDVSNVGTSHAKIIKSH